MESPTGLNGPGLMKPGPQPVVDSTNDGRVEHQVTVYANDVHEWVSIHILPILVYMSIWIYQFASLKVL